MIVDSADFPDPGPVSLPPRLPAGLAQGVRRGLPLVRRASSGGQPGLQIQVGNTIQRGASLKILKDKISCIRVSLEKMKTQRSVDTMICVSGLAIVGGGQWPHCRAARGTAPRRAAAQCPADAAARYGILAASY